MLRCEIAAQDSNASRPSRIIRAITKLGSSERFTRIRVAMAYATRSGCKSLLSGLKSGVENWAELEKKWLVSIDFGRSEVAGLKYLQRLTNSQVKIPDASKLLDRRLIPEQCFHAKTYIFDVPEIPQSAFGLSIGSGNLTMSGLHAGVEHGITLLWSKPFSRVERQRLDEVKTELSWWEDAWNLAEPLTDEILSRYAHLRARRPREDRTPAVKSFASPIKREIEIYPGLAWSKARYFWIQTLKLYKNRGAGLPGNQLDTKRGTRVYFGFSPHSVPRDTVLGSIVLQFNGKPSCTRNIRFGNNSMDKINLPIPGSEGPVSYDNTVVHFERIAPGRFRLSTGNKRIAGAWRKRSKDQGMLFALAGGRREFGFYN